MKVTVLYGHPADVAAFEDRYKNIHLPLAAKVQGVSRLELTRFTAAPDGGKPAFYRMAELYFATEDQGRTTLGSPEGKAAVADIGVFATGGANVMIGPVEG